MSAGEHMLRQAHSEGVGVGMVIAAGLAMRLGAEVVAREALASAGVRSTAEARALGIEAYDLRPLAPVFLDWAERRGRSFARGAGL